MKVCFGFEIVHFGREFSDTIADKMPKVQTQNEPWSRVIYAKPTHTFERDASKVSFDNKTFTCVYANFCSIVITIKPILGENYIYYHKYWEL